MSKEQRTFKRIHHRVEKQNKTSLENLNQIKFEFFRTTFCLKIKLFNEFINRSS